MNKASRQKSEKIKHILRPQGKLFTTFPETSISSLPSPLNSHILQLHKNNKGGGENRFKEKI